MTTKKKSDNIYSILRGITDSPPHNNLTIPYNILFFIMNRFSTTNEPQS